MEIKCLHPACNNKISVVIESGLCHYCFLIFQDDKIMNSERRVFSSLKERAKRYIHRIKIKESIEAWK